MPVSFAQGNVGLDVSRSTDSYGDFHDTAEVFINAAITSATASNIAELSCVFMTGRWVTYNHLIRPFSIEQYDDALFGVFGIEFPHSLERAVPKRRAEYLAGRILARRLLEEIGWKDYPLRANSHRCPMWPDGITGSISHTDSMAFCALASTSEVNKIGVDIERLLSPKTCTAIKNQIFNRAEQQLVAARPNSELACTLGFSAKESVFKALYPLVGQYFSFSEVTLLEINEEERSLTLELSQWLRAQLDSSPDYECSFSFDGIHVATRFALLK